MKKNKILYRIFEAEHKFLTNGGIIPILVIAFCGILICIIGMIYTHPKNWWMLLFDIPFGIFIIWAINKLTKFIIKNRDVFKL